MGSKKNEMMLLILLLMVFAIIFVIAFLDYKRGLPVFGIGIPFLIEDMVIMGLSFLSMGKIFYNILAH